MKAIILILLALMLDTAVAEMTLPPKAQEKQYLKTEWLKDPSFELGAGLVVSESGTVTYQTAWSSNTLSGRSISWNPSVAGTVTLLNYKQSNGTEFTVRGGSSGSLRGSCLVNGSDSTHTYTIEIYNVTAGALVKAENLVIGDSASWNFQKVQSQVNPTVDTIYRLRLQVTANEAVIYADNCTFGFEENIAAVNVSQVYSAAISGTDVVTNENVDWINGNCTNASTGVQTCTFTTGFFTQAPNCVATTGSGSTASVPTISSTSVTVNTRDTSNALTNASSQLSCQRSEPNSGFAVRMDQTNYGWTDYTPTITNCGAATVTYAQHKRSGPNLEIRMAGVCTTVSGSALKVSLPTGLTGNVSGDTLLDGDVGFTYTGGDARGIVPIMLTGERTVVQFARNNSASVYTAIPSNQNMANGQTFTFNVKIPILGWTENQSAPLIIGGVTSSYQGTARTEVAKINCDSGAAIMSQQGSWVSSVGNVASGACALTLTSGIFSSTPYCSVTMNDTDFFAGTAYSIGANPTSATAVSVDCYAAGDCSNYDFNIECTGPR